MMQNSLSGSQRIQKPLRRTVLIGAVAFFFVLSIALTALSYPFISSALYYRYDAKLKDILESIEHNTNTDDLRTCMETGQKSDRYYWLQQFMNRMVYDFELEYLYVVVPSEEAMTNVISATGETERVASERGLGLMEASHSYKPEKLKQYLSFWDAEGIHYLEEPSPYGRFYTGVMPLRDAAGKTLALICADLNIESLHQFILQFTLYTYLVIAVLCFLFGFIAIRWLSHKVTGPIKVLESASHDYIQKVESAAASHTHELISFQAPEIHTKNEVQSLSETISSLAVRMKENIQEVILAEERARKAEEEAATQARLAKLRQEEERVREERVTYARVSALSGDYISIYTVDPETEAYSAFVRSDGSASLSHLSETGERFFETARQHFASAVHADDLDRVTSQFTRENVLGQVQRDGFFTMEYRLLMDGVPTYVRLKAAMVQERDEAQLIVGITNIDAEVRRDQEYTRSLTEARNRANIDSLTGVKNQKAFADLQAQLDRQIAEKRHMEFAIVVLDILGLQAINDQQGTEAGDRCLREVCHRVCKIFEHSPVFRIDGDAFAVLAQGTDYDRLDTLIASVRESNDRAKADGGVLVACGLARHQVGQTAAEVTDSANARLAENKQALRG